MPGLMGRVAVSLPKRTWLGVVTVVLGAAVLLAGGCGTPAKTAGSNVGSGSPTQDAAAATTGGVPDNGGTTAPQAANTRTQMGLLIWVPSDWRVVKDTSDTLAIVPTVYADTWGKVDPKVGMVAVDVMASSQDSGTPADAYKADKRMVTSVSPAQSVSWLGLTGLRWSTTVGKVGSYGELRTTATSVGGGGGPSFMLTFQVMQPAPIDKYQAEADSILTAMKPIQ